MKIRQQLMIIVIVSVSTIGLLMTLVGLEMASGEMYERMEETLSVAVEGYTDNVNYLKESGIDIEVTVFEADTRVASSIEGVVGKKADPDVIEAVLKNGETYFVKDIIIGGKDFCGYYKPVQGGMLFAGKSTDNIKAVQKKMVIALLLVSIVLIVLTCIVTIIVLNRLVRRIIKVQKHVQTMTEGDLTQSIEMYDNAKDEIKIMSNLVATLQQQLASIVSTIKTDMEQLDEKNGQLLQSFEKITINVDNVDTAVEDMAQGATSQAQDATSVVEQVSNMGTVIDTSNAQVQNLEDTVRRMNDLSSQVRKVLDALIKFNGKTLEQIEAVSRQTMATNVSADKIKEAIQVIQEIAEQTNLLSLNASIEAARAGEQGRGFAVVADEIRNLANSSAESTKVIEDVVRELLENSSESVETMKHVNTDAQQQKKELEGTVSAFEKLGVEIDVVSKATVDIANQMDTLTQAREVITSVTENLSAVSQENAAATEETSASMQEVANLIASCAKDVEKLKELSDNLGEGVGIFHL